MHHAFSVLGIIRPWTTSQEGVVTNTDRFQSMADQQFKGVIIINQRTFATCLSKVGASEFYMLPATIVILLKWNEGYFKSQRRNQSHEFMVAVGKLLDNIGIFDYCS